MNERIFKALADSTRQKILQVIVKNEVAVSELVEVLRLPQSTVSRHLKVLRDAGLVDHRNSGTSSLYSPARFDRDPHGDHAASDFGDGENGNGAANGIGPLAATMIEWSKRQPLGEAVQRRIDAVLQSRRSESADFFGRLAHRWDQLRVECFGSSFHLEAMMALMPREWCVLDVGVGTGYMLPALATTFARVIGVDPADEMLDATRRRIERDGLNNVELHPAQATQLPIDSATVDLCIASLVLHHEPTPADALNEFARVIRPGGKLMLIEQEAHELSRFHEIMQDRQPGFDRGDLSRMVERSGFDRVMVRTLETAQPTTGSAPETPALFVLTADRAASHDHTNDQATTSRDGRDSLEFQSTNSINPTSVN